MSRCGSVSRMRNVSSSAGLRIGSTSVRNWRYFSPRVLMRSLRSRRGSFGGPLLGFVFGVGGGGGGGGRGGRGGCGWGGGGGGGALGGAVWGGGGGAGAGAACAGCG